MKLDGLVAKVDGDLGLARGILSGLGERFPGSVVELDDQQAVLKGVGLEDIGESHSLAGGDDGAEARLHDGPDGVLAARAAAEVGADDEDGRPLVRRVVEGKIGDFGAVQVGMIGLGGAAGRIALVGEEQGTEAGSLDFLEVARRNDQVGVDVAPVEHGQTAAVGDEGFHG